MNTSELVIATNNETKVNEYRSMLEPFGFTLKALKDIGIDSDLNESGMTYEDNAMIKAKAIWNILPVPVFADASGIEISALNGDPGIFTKRFAIPGQEIEKLMEKMKNAPYPERSAKLICVICYIDKYGDCHIIRREISGHIAPENTQYACNEYWPYQVFIPQIFDKPSRTLSDVDDSIRNNYSHRGVAAKHLAQVISVLNQNMSYEEMLNSMEAKWPSF